MIEVELVDTVFTELLMGRIDTVIVDDEEALRILSAKVGVNLLLVEICTVTYERSGRTYIAWATKLTPYADLGYLVTLQVKPS